jgi:hypothetical protein
MLGQAAGFAVLAAISPTSLLVMAVFLGSANPRTTALLYVAGAMLMTVAMAVAVLFVIRATGLNHPRQHDPRYGFRLGLGFLCLIVAVFVARRARRATVAAPVPAATTPAAGRPTAGTAPVGTAAAGMSAAGTATPSTAAAATAGVGPGFVGRLVAEPKPSTAFAVGVLLFAPSATFIAAVQVVATSQASVATTALALVIVVVLTGLIVWLPLLTYLAAPAATTRRLKALNGWLRANGRVLLMSALAVCGLILIISSSLALAGA